MAIDEENENSPSPRIKMDETSPLLFTPASTNTPDPNAVQSLRRRAYVAAYALLTCLSLSVVLFEPAQARIFESAFCRAWYQEHNPVLIGPGGVEEVHCKIPQVQRDVASLTGMQFCTMSSVGYVLIAVSSGWKQTLDAMPGTYSLPTKSFHLSAD